MVSCTPPWILDPTCSTVAQTDDSTANHFATCLVSRPPPPPAPPRPSFKRLPGSAIDIGGGANGAVWVVGTNAVFGGRGIYRWAGGGWVPASGGAVRIAVASDGSPWVTNSSNQIFHMVGSGWVKYPGLAQDVAVGANGAVWVVGTTPVPGGYGIYRWQGSIWARVYGGAVRIAVAPDGTAWVTNSLNQIFHLTASGPVRYPGSARDVAVGKDGTVWIVGTNPVPGGYGIYRWGGKAWAQQPGGAVNITVGPDGLPWVTNSADQIYAA